MAKTYVSRLKQLEALHRRYTGPVPKDIIAHWEAGGSGARKLRYAAADLRFWRAYLRARLSACRGASRPDRRAHIVEDIRTVWPVYRKAAKLKQQARRIDAMLHDAPHLQRKGSDAQNAK